MTDTAQPAPAAAFDAGDAAAVVADVRRTFDDRITHPLEWRLAQLDALAQMLNDHTDRFTEALRADLGKSEIEA